MGKKVKWFSSVKKALNPESKNEDQRASKSKRKWFRTKKHHSFGATSLDNVLVLPAEEEKINEINNDEVSSRKTNNDNVVLSEANNDEQSIPSNAVEVDKITDDEADVFANGAASEVVQLAMVNAGKMNQEVAAIKIQTAYRGYMARRALRALRGLVRLESLVQGSVVRRQSNNTLRCMQTLARVQSQIRVRRIRMSEENQALKTQLLEKQVMEIENLRMGEEWNDSIQSKEQIEASLIQKKEAAMRRERALAYAFSHQQNLKNSSKTPTTMFMDTANPAWGWSWLERWMAARPWESHSVTENELKSDAASLKTQTGTNGEIRNAYAQFHLNSENAVPNQPSNGEFHTTTATVAAAKEPTSSSKAGKSTPPKRNTFVGGDDSRSTVSIQSERNRRHSVHSSSARDDDSQASSPSLRSYMVPTESAKAKSRLQRQSEKTETQEKGSPKQLNKRLSYPASPARPRRHSGPPRVSSNSMKKQNECKKLER